MEILLRKIILFYQRHKPRVMPCCRFIPSCSEYMLLAIEKHGAIKGLSKGLWRIIRCNPLNKSHGIDYP